MTGAAPGALRPWAQGGTPEVVPKTLEVAGDEEGSPAHTSLPWGHLWFWTSASRSEGRTFQGLHPQPHPKGLWCFVTAALGSEYKVLAAPTGPQSLAWKARPGLAPSPILLSLLPGLTQGPSVPSGATASVVPGWVSYPKDPWEASASPHPGTLLPRRGQEGEVRRAALSSSPAPSCLWALLLWVPQHQAWAVGGFARLE